MNQTPYGRALLVALKETAGLPGRGLVLPVGSSPIVATLRPVAVLPDRLDPCDVSRLTVWRNRFVSAFLTEFVATSEQTSRWLTEAVGPRDKKILFMLDDARGRTFGYMGLDQIDWAQGIAEADAIVRGEDAQPGIMTRCLRTLLEWAQGQLGLATINLRVRSDNPAVRFYEKVGFQEFKRVPLRRTTEGQVARWIEDPTLKRDTVALIYMQWQPTS